MKRGRPATGRQRSAKLHLWVLPAVVTALEQLCRMTNQDKTKVVEASIVEYLNWFKRGN